MNVPFDSALFNFNRVSPREILLKPRFHYTENNDEAKLNDFSEHMLIINASPVEFGSSLLVPSMSKNIRQKVTLEGLELLINLMLLSNDPYITIFSLVY